MNQSSDTETNEKCWFAKYWHIVLSVCSLIANYIGLCWMFPRIVQGNNLGFDYMGVVVGILALLVVFTVSWQIYNAVEVKKELDNARDERIRLNEEMNNRLSAVVSNVCDYMGDIAEMVSKSKEANWEYFITSIKVYNKHRAIDNREMKSIAKSHIIKSINIELSKCDEFTPQLTFCIRIAETLKEKDIIPFRNDIEREGIEMDILKILNIIINDIYNRQKSK